VGLVYGRINTYSSLAASSNSITSKVIDIRRDVLKKSKILQVNYFHSGNVKNRLQIFWTGLISE